MPGEFVVAVGITAFYGDAELVTGLHGLFILGEGGEGKDALRLVADVEEDRIHGDGDDGGVDLFRAAGAIDSVGAGGSIFAEKLGKIFEFFGGVGRG